MQVLVLAVQNDAPARNIGVATSTATFFRSMGGSLGVAIFGAIFASRLASELAAIPGAGGLSGGANIRPDQVHALPPAVRHDFLLAFVDALQPVFLVGAGVHRGRVRARAGCCARCRCARPRPRPPKPPKPRRHRQRQLRHTVGDGRAADEYIAALEEPRRERRSSASTT